MLINLNTVLADAKAKHYAVPAFDISENHLIRIILDTAQAEGSPIILMAHDRDLEGFGMDYIAGLVKGVTHKYTIPIILHLDHATDFELIKRAIAHGFTSVMYDGSALPLDENIQNTREIVEYAHQYNVSVEGELGFIGGKTLDGDDDESGVQLTEAADVERFAAETAVDALAISIGTAHGIYESLPNLDIERLEAITSVSDVPLVLHGGSGTPPDQLQIAFAKGITKLNIAADLRISLKKAYQIALDREEREDPLPLDLYHHIAEVVSETVKEKMRLLGSSGRY